MRAKQNGQPKDVLRHLTTKCGVDVAVAQKMIPNREGLEDSSRSALPPEALDRYNALVRREFADDAVLRACLLLLPLTGLRVAEICSLRTEDVGRDGDKVSWTFIGKGQKRRTVPLWRKARRVFDPYMASERPRSRYVFPNVSRTGHLRPATVQLACRHLASLDPALRDLTPHVLRHTFATMALLNCHDIHRTQEILGHGRKGSIKISVVMLRYLHPDVSRGEHSNISRKVASRANPGKAGQSLLSVEHTMAKQGDWYWKSMYSKAPFSVTQEWTEGMQPIGRRNKSKSRKNGSYPYAVGQFSVTEAFTEGIQPVNRRNKSKSRKNGSYPYAWGPFSVTEAFTEGMQPVNRRNGAKVFRTAEAARRAASRQGDAVYQWGASEFEVADWGTISDYLSDHFTRSEVNQIGKAWSEYPGRVVMNLVFAKQLLKKAQTKNSAKSNPRSHASAKKSSVSFKTADGRTVSFKAKKAARPNGKKAASKKRR